MSCEQKGNRLLSCGLGEGTAQFLTEMLEGMCGGDEDSNASLFNGLSGMIVLRHLTAFGWHGDDAEEC